VLTSDRLHEGLKLEPQRLSLGDRKGDRFTLGDCVGMTTACRTNLGVLVKGQLLGEVVAHEHASLAEHAQLPDLGRRQPVAL